MATTTQKKAFIDLIAPLAQKAYKQFGKPLPSVCISMAAVECAWGTAGSCKYNSYMGQKVGTGKTATKYWSGNYFNSKTQEVVNQSTGQMVTIKDNFRAYDSVEQCIFNYYELLNTSLYSKVLAGSSYKDQMQQVKACCYMTSITEVNTCITIIEQNNLTQYDGAQGSCTGATDCYPVPAYTGSSIADALRSIGIDSSYSFRGKIAEKNGILGYKGSADQNRYMLELLKGGKLKKV